MINDFYILYPFKFLHKYDKLVKIFILIFYYHKKKKRDQLRKKSDKWWRKISGKYEKDKKMRNNHFNLFKLFSIGTIFSWILLISLNINANNWDNFSWQSLLERLSQRKDNHWAISSFFLPYQFIYHFIQTSEEWILSNFLLFLSSFIMIFYQITIICHLIKVQFW